MHTHKRWGGVAFEVAKPTARDRFVSRCQTIPKPVYALSRHLAIILPRAHSYTPCAHIYIYTYVHYMPRGLLARAIISKRVQATNADILATFSLLPQIYPSTRIIQHPPFFSSSSLPSNFRNFHPFSFSSPSHGGFPSSIDRSIRKLRTEEV